MTAKKKKKFAPEFNYKTLLRRLQADLYYTLTEFYAGFEINLSWCVHVVFIPMAKKEYQNNKVHSTFNACVIYSGFSVKTNPVFFFLKGGRYAYKNTGSGWDRTG